MTLKEMKKKVLALIEELNAESEYLTDDPDIQNKIDFVINQVMFELVRLKKLPKYIEIQVHTGETVDFGKIKKESGFTVYQLNSVKGASHELKASGTLIKVRDEGILEIEFFAFPEPIDSVSCKTYEFDLPYDVLEIMPYGVAADLLKSDESAQYGSVYATRYENMKMELDPRYAMNTAVVEGGVYI